MFKDRTVKEKVGFTCLCIVVVIVWATLGWFQGRACAPYAPGEGPAACETAG